jgi:hypothetical protein
MGRPPHRYQDAGVDIERGNALVERIKPLAQGTVRAGVIGGVGGFGALFRLAGPGYRDPILVSSTDGVGTKLKLAVALDGHDTISIDSWPCAYDVVVQCAEHYGLLANRHRTAHLAACRAALDAPTPAPAEPETVEAFLSRVLGTDANRCPHCGQGRLRPIRALAPLPRATGPPLLRWAASTERAGAGFYEVQDDPLRFPTPATSTEAAARRLASMPPIDPSPAQDHTSRPAQLPDP